MKEIFKVKIRWTIDITAQGKLKRKLGDLVILVCMKENKALCNGNQWMTMD